MAKGKLEELFHIKKPIIGMIHLSSSEGDKYKVAQEELDIYEEAGVDGAIIENYHANPEDVFKFMIDFKESNLKRKITLGVNILPNEFEDSIPLAAEYGAKFVQLDHIAGTYKRRGGTTLDIKKYTEIREKYPNIVVLGGVWPKYYDPIEGSNLEEDLKQGMQRADAIVVTGEKTGKETPLDKIKRFREIIGNYSLIMGAGANFVNTREQLKIVDGLIVGTVFKDGNTSRKVILEAVIEFMEVVKETRKTL